jgi:hypothetical protein
MFVPSGHEGFTIEDGLLVFLAVVCFVVCDRMRRKYSPKSEILSALVLGGFGAFAGLALVNITLVLVDKLSTITLGLKWFSIFFISLICTLVIGNFAYRKPLIRK